MNKYGLEQEYRQISQGGSSIMNSTVQVSLKIKRAVACKIEFIQVSKSQMTAWCNMKH